MLRLTITKKKFSLNYREVLKDGLLQTLGVTMVVFFGAQSLGKKIISFPWTPQNKNFQPLLTIFFTKLRTRFHAIVVHNARLE